MTLEEAVSSFVTKRSILGLVLPNNVDGNVLWINWIELGGGRKWRTDTEFINYHIHDLWI